MFNMSSMRALDKFKKEKANFLVRRLIGACTGKELDAIDKLQRNRLSLNNRLSKAEKMKQNLLR